MILWMVLEPRREHPLLKPRQIQDIQKERKRRAQFNRTTKAEPRLRGREEAFEPDPVVEVEGDDLEAVRTRAANTITRAVRSGRLGRALATATPPNPPPLDPEYLNTPHRPQNLPPHVKLRRPPPPKASTRSLPVPAQPPKADAPQPEPNQPKVAPQPRQRGFVRLQHAAREPPAQPIPMDTARDTVYDLPDHVWRTRPTREPGGLTVPQPELLVRPNTEVHAMDVDDEESPPRPAAKPRATAPWRRAPTYALEAEGGPRSTGSKAACTGKSSSAETHSCRVCINVTSCVEARSWRSGRNRAQRGAIICGAYTGYRPSGRPKSSNRV